MKFVGVNTQVCEKDLVKQIAEHHNHKQTKPLPEDPETGIVKFQELSDHRNQVKCC